MTKRDDLLALAERVEQAAEGGPPLNHEIGSLMHRLCSWHPADCMRRFSTSLDAAMTLVPASWDWQAASYGEDGAYGVVWRHGWHDDTAIHVYAPCTPALALTAAALRARAAMEVE